MITVAGWTWEDVARCPLKIALDLLRYWAEYPPSHILHRSWYGFGQDKGPKRAQDTLQFGATIKSSSELPDYIKNA